MKSAKPAANSVAATEDVASKKYTIKSEFWIGGKNCKVGEKVQLTASQIKRLAGAIEA